MRLLNTTTHDFREFFDGQIPPYAILSHRWGDDEVSFQEFEASMMTGPDEDYMEIGFFHRGDEDEVSFQKFDSGTVMGFGEGRAKIKNCCALAKENGYAWVWIDTCCIDKKSSAEVSEAINSMYR